MRVAETGPEGLNLAHRTEEPLEPGEVRLRVLYCGICGTDVNHVTHFPPGTVIGHEITGRIVELGAGVTGWSIGDRVCAFPFEACGTCDECGGGRPHLCAEFPFSLGMNRPGGYAERVVVRQSMLIPLPPSLDDRTAALVEPLAVGLHAISVSGAGPDAPVAVLGAGPIGLLAVLALHAKGFRRIAVVEPNPRRRANVEKLGVPAFVNADPSTIRAALGTAPAVVFECAGFPGAVAEAIALIAPRGTVMVTGVPPVPVAFELWSLMAKEGRIATGAWYERPEFEEAAHLLANGQVRVDALPLTSVRLEDAPAAMAELMTRRSPWLKVLIQP